MPLPPLAFRSQSMSFDVSGADVHVVAIRPVANPLTTFTNHHAILHVCDDNDYWRGHLTPKPCSQSDGEEGQSPLGELNSGCSSPRVATAVVAVGKV